MRDNLTDPEESLTFKVRHKGNDTVEEVSGDSRLKATITIDCSLDEFDPNISVDVVGKERDEVTYAEALASVFVQQFLPMYGKRIAQEVKHIRREI